MLNAAIALGAAMPLTAAAQTPAPTPWLARQQAELAGLDKVRAQATSINVAVGQAATYGTLTIQVRSCLVRPPDQAQDATAFVEITDSRPGAPGFRGWLLVSAPSLSMLEHPIYDVRLVACK